MFGFQAINNSGSVTLNSEYPTLVFSERGQVVVQNTSVVDRPAVGSFSFSSPKTSLAPPKVFIRFNSGRHPSCEVYLGMLGSPGNWTGCIMYAGAIGGGTLPRHVIDYVICETATPSVNSDYGMVIYDSSGNPTYKSEDRPVKYNKFTRFWTSSAINQFNFLYSPSGVTIDSDDFMDISSMNRGPSWMSGANVSYTSMQILSGGVRMLRLGIQIRTTGGNINAAGYQFCIPICKFPSDVYFNS